MAESKPNGRLDWKLIGMFTGISFVSYMIGLMVMVNYFIAPVLQQAMDNRAEIAAVKDIVYTNVSNFTGVTVELKSQGKTLDVLQEDVKYIRRKVGDQ